MWNHSDLQVPSMQEIHSGTCAFCETRMESRDIGDCYSGIPRDFKRSHLWTVTSMAEMYGEFMLEESTILEKPEEEKAMCFRCPLCGWWCVFKFIRLETENQTWHMYYGLAGALRNLEPVDLREPIAELKRYLASKDIAKFDLHPRKLEEIITSVFRSQGYRAALTSFSGDGGIDIVLQDKDEKLAGVQVKRYKSAVGLEQIRSFIGALTLRGLTQGVYVTTSDFQAGVAQVVCDARACGIQMKLIDSERLFELLKISPVADWDCYPNFKKIPRSGRLSDLVFLEEERLYPLWA